jgi:SAM-dependent methyltransferase
MKRTVNIKKIDCHICNSSKVLKIIDFGYVGLAGAFLKKKEILSEKKYRMRLYFCKNCLTLQVIDKIKPKTLFKDYFYFSSAIQTLRHHFNKLAEEVKFILRDKVKSNVLEFGCNDGILLKPLQSKNIKNLIGIDPASNIVKKIKNKNIKVINNFFNFELSNKIKKKYGKMDVILANNVFAHIYNLNNVTKGIKNILKSDGSFIFEVHYLGKMIKELQYDMIYHEHVFYHSMLSLTNLFKKNGLIIYDIKPIKIHAGSMRYYVCHKKFYYNQTKNKKVKNLIEKETRNMFHKNKTFHNFANKIEKTKVNLNSLLNRLKKNNKIIYGYGASGRANTILQYCGLNKHNLPLIIDDSSAKHGYYTPGSHIKICSADILSTKKKPDYILLFAWSFLKEVVNRNKQYILNGGKIILPLPKVKVLDYKKLKKLIVEN